MARQPGKRTEGSLLLLVMLIAATGFCLVFLAKTRVAAPSDAVNINTVSADQLALTLRVDPEIAKLLVQQRDTIGGFNHTHQLYTLPLLTRGEAHLLGNAIDDKRIDINTVSARTLQDTLTLPRFKARRIVDFRALQPNGVFARPIAAARTPMVDERAITAVEDRLLVREPLTVFWWFAMSSAMFLAGGFAVCIALRRRGVQGDPLLAPCALLLAAFGVMVVFSIKDPLRDMPAYQHQVYAILVGLVAMYVGAVVPAFTRRNMRRYPYIWALAAVGLMACLMLFGKGPEGVRLSLGFFQPVEIIKVLLVLFAASYLCDRADQISDTTKRWRPGNSLLRKGISLPRTADLGPMLGIYALALVLFMVVRDLGPAVLLFGTFVSIVYLATGRSGVVWVAMLAIILGCGAAYALHIGVAQVRVDMWLHPWHNSHPNGMQLAQGLWGMASGGVWGSGLGLGAPGVIPRAGSDLAFASVGEELGLIGSLLVLVVYAVLVSRGLRIALGAAHSFDRLLAYGLTSLIACQTIIIVAGVVGLLPLSGITLPFVSYGGSSLLVDFLIIGVLRAISAKQGEAAHDEVTAHRKLAARNYATAVSVVLIGVVGIGRLFYTQAIRADELAGRAIVTPDADGQMRAKINPRLLLVEKAIPRGTIYDRKMRVLATSRLDEISKDMPGELDMARRYYAAGRYYPRGADCAHLVGYIAPEYGGPVGLEQQFNGDLRGFNHYSELLPDYRAKDLPGFLTGVRPRRGMDVVTTIDADLQESVLKALRKAQPADTHAAVVALDPATGDVVVSASLPSFNPNSLSAKRWTDLINNVDGQHRLFDRARNGYYPPGSTLKVAVAATALEEAVQPQYDCAHTATNLHWMFKRQRYSLRQISDDKGEGAHGRLGLDRAVRESCNLYFANLGLRLGPSRLYHALADQDRFALSRVQPIDQFARDLATNSFGQGTMLVTPTEMARIASAVANRGRMMRPAYWREIKVDGVSVRKRNAELMSRPVGEENAAVLAQMLRGVVTNGTAAGVFNDVPVQVAGKTGTAQTDAGNRRAHSWFAGYAPFSRPEYAFACIIENGGYGKRGAAPVCARMLQEIYGKR